MDMTTENTTDRSPSKPVARRAWTTFQPRPRGWSGTRVARDRGRPQQAAANAKPCSTSYLATGMTQTQRGWRHSPLAEHFGPRGRRRWDRSQQGITRPCRRNVEEGRMA